MSTPSRSKRDSQSARQELLQSLPAEDTQRSPAWKRPVPTRVGPNRGFGGFYRSADREVNGKLFRGVPLQTAEDTVVAAVRMSYRIVDAQIERGMRIAGSLRDAAERTGSGDPKHMVDATERLLSRAMLVGLKWIEGAAAESENPVRRLFAAEYHMLGSLFGLASDSKKKDGARHDRSGAQPVAPSAPAEPLSALPRVSIRNKAAAKQRRRVKRLVTWEMPSELLSAEQPDVLYFCPAAAAESPVAGVDVISGKVWVDAQGQPVLQVDATIDKCAGVWCAGVYRDDDEQIGFVEVEL